MQFRLCRMKMMYGEDSNFVDFDSLIPYCFSIKLSQRPPPFHKISQQVRSICECCFKEWQEKGILIPNTKLMKFVKEIVEERACCQDCKKTAKLNHTSWAWEQLYSRIQKPSETETENKTSAEQHHLTDSFLQVDLGPEWTLYSTCDQILFREGGAWLMDWKIAENKMKQLIAESVISYSPLVSLIFDYCKLGRKHLLTIDAEQEKNLYGTLWCLDCAKRKKMNVLFFIKRLIKTIKSSRPSFSIQIKYCG